MEPERADAALKARCTIPNEPLQGLLPLVLHAPLDVRVPFVSSQFSVMFIGPPPGAIGIVVGVDQTPPAYVMLYAVLPTVAVNFAPAVVSGSPGPKSAVA